MNQSTLRVGVDVHLDDLVVRAITKADGHEVLKRFCMTNNLPGSQTALAGPEAEDGSWPSPYRPGAVAARRCSIHSPELGPR